MAKIDLSKYGITGTTEIVYNLIDKNLILYFVSSFLWNNQIGGHKA